MPFTFPRLLTLLGLVLSQTTHAKPQADTDQLPISPKVYRGTLSTNTIPFPQRGTPGRQTTDLYQTNPALLSGTNMLNFNPIGASGPDPGQSTRNISPSAAFCGSEEGQCGASNYALPTDTKDCPTGIDWLALGSNFDQKDDNDFDPIHSFEIHSAQNGPFFNPPITPTTHPSSHASFTVEVYTGTQFQPAATPTVQPKYGAGAAAHYGTNSHDGSVLIHTQQCVAKGNSNVCKIVLPRPVRSHNIWIKAYVPSNTVPGTVTLSICDLKMYKTPWSRNVDSITRKVLLNDGIVDSFQEHIRFAGRNMDSLKNGNDGKGAANGKHSLSLSVCV